MDLPGLAPRDSHNQRGQRRAEAVRRTHRRLRGQGSGFAQAYNRARTQLRRRLQTVGLKKVRGRLAAYAGRVRVRQVPLQRVHVQHDKG